MEEIDVKVPTPSATQGRHFGTMAKFKENAEHEEDKSQDFNQTIKRQTQTSSPMLREQKHGIYGANFTLGMSGVSGLNDDFSDDCDEKLEVMSPNGSSNPLTLANRVHKSDTQQRISQMS